MNSKLNTLKAKLKSNLDQRKNLNMSVYTPSRDSSRNFSYKTYDTNLEIWEKDEDFIELKVAEEKYKLWIQDMINVDRLNQEVRENIIWKIKKIWDTFELKDETFYSSVLLNDLQIMWDKDKIKDGKYSLDELFDFSKTSNGQDKCKR